MITTFRYSLSTILAVLDPNDFKRIESDLFFTSISTSSLECKTGSLFIPLKDKRDGHEFIIDALSRGASGFLCEKKNKILNKLNESQLQKAIFVEDTLVSLGKLGEFHRKRFQPLLIAVTGSSGKTTTKELLGNLFQFLKKRDVVITEKNFNNEIGVPFTLFRITEYTKVAIIEMGMNQRGEIERLSKMSKPNLALITNIGSAHVENLKSPERIAEEKSDILFGMEKGSILFLPEDANHLSIVSRKAKKLGILLQFWKNGSSSKLKIVQEYKNGFKLNYQGHQITWKIPGKTLLSNVRGMVEIGNFLKIEDQKIAKAIGNYKPPARRLHIKRGYFQIIDDTYNANPESMLSSIQASYQLANKKPLVLVLGSMKELGKFSKYYHEQIGEALRQYPEVTLITYGKDAEWIATKRKIGNNFSFSDAHSNFEEFVKIAHERHPKGSTILIKGSRSMKMERIVDCFLAFKS
ncbi:UDP-N-acetylmuramoyl-tripeptide--D-alanyl-D-alanine ligase [Leptospira ognonensis]|uniref:UDP-N-acetylmuramoyl-tripeptide--D-alanyl-D-alanine ligase n=1 Tax=Leptospira ognonensis TaxID=2484945 RepID=A0A4R9JY78_9LEPT|nr:UDP-N-acetylmuramoyl-tripeptide--D-alanyl-D-alanine ligase [Leptospira ognonensis]TGL57482.1 UDP-N-acetylmuramoyl-tripeptide--D-alanyl-D-alanine ligase [Leptospira ognonensis]